MATETHQDVTDQRRGANTGTGPLNVSTGPVRDVQAALAEGLADIHRAAAMIADLYALVSVDALAVETPAHRLAEIARLVARDGMRASRLIKKAAERRAP